MKSSPRADLAGAAAAAALVAAAFVVPLLADPHWRATLYAGAAPLFGARLAHIGPGTGPAIVIAALVAWYGPGVARRCAWTTLVLGTWACALAWAFALAMVDGWQRGFASRLAGPDEYLAEVGGVAGAGGVGPMLSSYARRIIDFQPDSWTVHVAGHPPGALLVFVGLDRIGLGGPTWAAVVCTVVGSSAAAAVLIAVAALSGRTRARSAAPFLALTPGAVWVAVSADGFFAGVAAWAVALLALAAAPGRRCAALASGAGVLLGYAVFLNYGLVLLAGFVVAVLVAARTARPLPYVVLGAGAVVAVFAASGFWWLDGYHAVLQRYYQGIAAERPAGYWVWANLAAATCATGLAVPASLHRSLAPRRIRRREGASLLVLAALAAVVLADLSALSKAETERIWLPFTTWLLVSPAFLPVPRQRGWLAVQAGGTLLVAHLILTHW